MRSIHSILVPVDFSEVSANAFRYTLHLADHLDAGVDLLYAVPLSDDSLVSIPLTAQLASIGKEKLADFLTKGINAVSGRLKHIPTIRSYIRSKNLQTAIHHHVKEQENDLIVMGTHGETDYLESFFGTNTSRLVARGICPVLVVPKDFSFRPLRSICYATDLTHLDAFHAGHLLKALRVFKPRLDFVHVKTGKEKKTKIDIDLIREVFDRSENGLRTRFHILEENDVVEEIFDYAKATKADLVVMHRLRQGWLRRLFGKSNTREAALDPSLPIMVLPWSKEDELQTAQTRSLR